MTAPSHQAAWLAIGFGGQLIFTARFLVQWAASERKRASVVPVAFWWISLCGGVTLLAYAVHRQDPPFILGQGMGLFVYVRNLMLVSKSSRRAEKRRMPARYPTGKGGQKKGQEPNGRDSAEMRALEVKIAS